MLTIASKRQNNFITHKSTEPILQTQNKITWYSAKLSNNNQRFLKETVEEMTQNCKYKSVFLFTQRHSDMEKDQVNGAIVLTFWGILADDSGNLNSPSLSPKGIIDRISIFSALILFPWCIRQINQPKFWELIRDGHRNGAFQCNKYFAILGSNVKKIHYLSLAQKKKSLI